VLPCRRGERRRAADHPASNANNNARTTRDPFAFNCYPVLWRLGRSDRLGGVEDDSWAPVGTPRNVSGKVRTRRPGGHNMLTMLCTDPPHQTDGGRDLRVSLVCYFSSAAALILASNSGSQTALVPHSSATV